MNKPLNLDGVRIVDSSNNPLPVNVYKVASKNIDIYLTNKVAAGVPVFIDIASGISSTDKVAVTAVDKYMVKNNSTYTSIDEIASDKFVIYPTSTHPKIFNYRMKENHPKGMVSDLYNLQGQLVSSQLLNTGTGTIDFNNARIQTGYYILRVKTTENQYCKMILL